MNVLSECLQDLNDSILNECMAVRVANGAPKLWRGERIAASWSIKALKIVASIAMVAGVVMAAAILPTLRRPGGRPQDSFCPDGILVEATVTGSKLNEAYFFAYCDIIDNYAPILLRSHEELLALISDMYEKLPDDTYHQALEKHSNIEEIIATYDEAYFKEHDLILYTYTDDIDDTETYMGLFWNETIREYQIHYLVDVHHTGIDGTLMFPVVQIETAKKLEPNCSVKIKFTTIRDDECHYCYP